MYPDIPSAIKPVSHGPEVPVPTPPEHIQVEENMETMEVEDHDTSDTYHPPSSSIAPRPLTQGQLNDLTRDLGLSKDSFLLLVIARTISSPKKLHTYIGQAFKYLQQKFPQIGDVKLNAGIFDGPQIRTFLKDKKLP